MPPHKANVLIRADAGFGIGFGHLVRCLAVAEQLVHHQGAKVTVAMRAPGAQARDRVTAAGAELSELAQIPEADLGAGTVWPTDLQQSDAIASLGTEHIRWDAVIVDHYSLDIAWESIARDRTETLVVIDDLANRKHAANILVDHNWYGEGTAERYDSFVPADTLLLLGPRYCMLGAAYPLLRQDRAAVKAPPETVLVNFGGTDVTGQTMSAVEAALIATPLNVEVVVGSRTSLTPELRALGDTNPRVTVHVELPTLAPVLARADLVIGASGTGTWERLCLRVPSIVTTVAEGQSGVTRALADAGVCIWLGVAGSVSTTDYIEALKRALSGQLSLPPAIVDGHGSERIALATLGVNSARVTARSANITDDASFVSAILSKQVSAGPHAWHNAQREFDSLMESKQPVDVLETAGVPVGMRVGPETGDHQVFLDQYLREWEIEP